MRTLIQMFGLRYFFLFLLLLCLKHVKSSQTRRHTDTHERLRSAEWCTERIPVLFPPSAWMLQQPGGRWLKHVLTQRDFIHRNKCILHTGVCGDALWGDLYQQAPARAASECCCWPCTAVSLWETVMRCWIRDCFGGNQLWSILPSRGGNGAFITCLRKHIYNL